MTPAPAATHEERVEGLTERVPQPRYPDPMENGVADATNAPAASELAAGSKEWELRAVGNLWNKQERLHQRPLVTVAQKLDSSIEVPIPVPGLYTRCLQYAQQVGAAPDSDPDRVIVERHGDDIEEMLIITRTTVFEQRDGEITDAGFDGVLRAKQRLEAVDLAIENWPEACRIDGRSLPPHS